MEHWYIAGGMLNGVRVWESIWQFFSKSQNIMWFIQSPPGYTPKRTENTYPNKQHACLFTATPFATVKGTKDPNGIK